MASRQIAPILSVDQYQQLISQRRNGRKIKNTNCYLMPNQIERRIQEGSLSYEENEAGVLIFLDKGGALQLYPFVDPDIHFVMERKDKPVIAEFLGLAVLNDRSKMCIERLKESGFAYKTTSRRLTLDFDPEKYPLDLSAQEEYGYQVMIARQEHMEPIYQIWTDVFDPVVNPLPSKEELTRQIALGNILCAVMATGEVAGAFQSELVDKRKELTRGAVLPQFRRKGIIQALVYADLQTAYQAGITKHCSWVEEKNGITIQFFKKLGFDFDGKFSEEYLLTE